MTMGRPSKPIEQKRRTGNPGKRALPVVGTLAVVPAADGEWHDLPVSVALDKVLALGVVWIAQTDAPKVILLRDSAEDYQRLRAAGASAKEIREARAELSSLLSQLGFDPTARSKLGLAEVKARSKLEELKARRG